ncbi:histidine phosphatase family protein [Paucilactobacillus suebicus]|uniref:Phosphoglycerate mutase n=1 Tax=Paucilactobacillus suebicus DSM 5007 = KCTC 3549 TaxID=1423807 RepID=A0A0R1W2D7_9LACO|nr:histidine phosphatase family protein [Paucilactobacillus suebicus]KRM10299.1 phosphoglycerate mutase [Paucilactobacillus suebicus DSM 5007 = KCTC 3549]
MSEINIYFVRHGQTLLNTFKRMQGWCDSDLTEQGKQDAIKVGEKLKNEHFSYVYSSDTGRAIETRDIVLSKFNYHPKTVSTLHSFREILFGYYEGLDSLNIWEEIGGKFGYHTQADIINDKGLKEVRRLMKLADPSHMAETYDQVKNRWQSGVNYLKENCEDGSNILVITHGSALRTFADSLGIDTIGNFPDNGSVSVLQVTDNDEAFTTYNNKKVID